MLYYKHSNQLTKEKFMNNPHKPLEKGKYNGKHKEMRQHYCHQ